MQNQIINGIKAARIKNGLTKTELAHKLNIDSSVLKSWEIGAITPTIEITKTMSVFLKVSADSLIFSEHRKALSLDGISQERKMIIRQLCDSFRNK